MIDMYFIKKKRLNNFNQDELIEASIVCWNSYIRTHTKFHTVKRYKNHTLPEDLNKEISQGLGKIIIISEPGTLVDYNFEENVIDKFCDNNKIKVLGLKIVGRFSNRIIDAGIIDPLKEMPIWKNFKEPESSPDTYHQTNNLYLDGKFIIIKRDIWNKIKFNKESGMYWAINFCYDVVRDRNVISYWPEVVLYDNYYESDKDKLEKIYGSSRDWFKDKLMKQKTNKEMVGIK